MKSKNKQLMSWIEKLR